MFETLMFLVGVHAQVSSAAAPLLERTLAALVDDLADECLRCFRQVKRFGMGGMLRVRFRNKQFDPSLHSLSGDSRNRVHASDAFTSCQLFCGENTLRTIHQNLTGLSKAAR